MNLTELTPLELNRFRFSGNHTPLTPEQIESMRQAAAQPSENQSKNNTTHVND